MKFDFETIESMVETDLEGYQMDLDDPDCITECFSVEEDD